MDPHARPSFGAPLSGNEAVQKLMQNLGNFQERMRHLDVHVYHLSESFRRLAELSGRLTAAIAMTVGLPRGARSDLLRTFTGPNGSDSGGFGSGGKSLGGGGAGFSREDLLAGVKEREDEKDRRQKMRQAEWQRHSEKMSDVTLLAALKRKQALDDAAGGKNKEPIKLAIDELEARLKIVGPHEAPTPPPPATPSTAIPSVSGVIPNPPGPAKDGSNSVWPPPAQATSSFSLSSLAHPRPIGDRVKSILDEEQRMTWIPGHTAQYDLKKLLGEDLFNQAVGSGHLKKQPLGYDYNPNALTDPHDSHVKALQEFNRQHPFRKLLTDINIFRGGLEAFKKGWRDRIANVPTLTGDEKKEAKDKKEKEIAHRKSVFSRYALGAVAATTGAVQAASPDVWSTFTGSIQLLAGTIGLELIPSFMILSSWAQRLAKYLASTNPESRSTLGTGAMLGTAALAVTALLGIPFAVTAAVAALALLAIEFSKFKLPKWAGGDGREMYPAPPEEIAARKKEYERGLSSDKEVNDNPLTKELLAKHTDAEGKIDYDAVRAEADTLSFTHLNKASRVRPMMEAMEEKVRSDADEWDLPFGIGDTGRAARRQSLTDLQDEEGNERNQGNQYARLAQIIGKDPAQQGQAMPQGAAAKSLSDEQKNAVQGMAISLQSFKATPQYSSVEEAYKRIQISALGDDPMTVQLKRMHEEGILKMIEVLKSVDVHAANFARIALGHGP